MLYTGGRDGLVISWDLGVPMTRRAHRYGYGKQRQSMRRWEVMTNWADDIIEEEDEGEEPRSDGDVLGEVTGKKKRIHTDKSISYEDEWETDVDAYQAFKARPPTSSFRQAVQMHSDWINDILLCNYNQTLISASSDGTIKAWSPHAHSSSSSLSEPTVVGSHTDYVRCLTHSREQQWFASGSFDRTVKIWDLPSAHSKVEPLLTLNPPDASGPKASLYALATDPYGTVIASGSPERVIRMWDPRSGKRIAKLVGHTDNIRAILVSDDAKYLLTGSADASVKLWSLSSQRCLHTFTHHTESVWSLFSTHPALEVFYSGDRSGIVCKVDVEGCADVAEGECIVLCQDAGTDRPNSPGAEGINKIVAMDDNLLWTASGSSSVKRWRVPQRRAVRAAALSTESTVDSPVSSTQPVEYQGWHSGRNDSLDLPRAISPPRSHSNSLSHDLSNSRSSSPFATRSSRADSIPPSATANLHACDALGIDPTQEGESSWYGIPFESLVRLTSPNDTGFGLTRRGHDPEIATLYSAASVMSVPRMVRSPTLGLSSNGLIPSSSAMMRSASPAPGLPEPHTQGSFPPPAPGAMARAAFDLREVAADAVPLHTEPDEEIAGEQGLVRSVLLNDRVHALTVDTAGEVAVWDVVRGACLGRYAPADVAAAVTQSHGSHGGSDSGSGGTAERAKSPREALETVRERIEGEAVVPTWSAVDTKTGVLTVHLSERCFEAEVYADEAGYGPERQFSEETRLNVGKWVLKNLFHGFIREEQRQSSRRARSHDGSINDPHARMQRYPTQIHVDSASSGARSRSSSDVSIDPHPSQYNRHPHSRSATIVVSPNMIPAAPPPISAAPRSSPLMAPLIPLQGGLRDSSGLSPIPQSPTVSDTPGFRTTTAHQQEGSTTPAAVPPPSVSATASNGSSTGGGDYFSLRARRPSVSATPAAVGNTATPADDYGAWANPGPHMAIGSTPGTASPAMGASRPGTAEAVMPNTPSTPTVGSLMGRLKAFGKNSRKQPSETSGATAPTDAGPTASVGGGSTEETPAPPPSAGQALLAGPITPPSSSDAPPLPLPPHTALVICEEAPSGWMTLYRGNVGSTGVDARVLEDAMPLWLLECLLQNKTPAIPITKIGFVLLPHQEPDGELLPELLNTAQSKLTASRFLRVRKLTHHVQDKLEKLQNGTSSPAPLSTPRSSLDRRSIASAHAHHAHGRPRADEQFEILCNDVVLPLDMTLAAVRQFVWRQGAELVMHYRRKPQTPPPMPNTHP
ncbi:uncharacterized protein BXZ73DRAFT_44505 [Epithele typhae]|uniref:uncharacterized protein n=1 Tax=Epithele typhae TaxID=378194 RepID=UPI002007E860|nr:uncharacterized protein BXZ73DRAFT_44505 [Epithele typhae]KAH9938898.1 hypothetical protein BXZ73DRAFT_44505 [Epithele typhae]